MAKPNPLSSMKTMINALKELQIPAATETINEEPPAIPPPRYRRFYGSLTAQEVEICWQNAFNLMTNSQEYTAQYFEDLISKFDTSELQMMASFLTSDSDCLMAIARSKYGSKRLHELLGKSDYVDCYFAVTINRRFIQFMTDKHASSVAMRGMRVFNKHMKELMYEQILRFALDLARDQHGYMALNDIITDLDNPDYRNKLLDIVANNALELSYDDYGTFVVEHVLKLYDMRYTRNIAVNLHGHCVDLSCKKYGSYIMKLLLSSEESVMELVVSDILRCKEEELGRLARSEYGNFVVSKALEYTGDHFTAHLYGALLNKLMPVRDILHKSHGSKIAATLDRIRSFRLSLSQTS